MRKRTRLASSCACFKRRAVAPEWRQSTGGCESRSLRWWFSSTCCGDLFCCGRSWCPRRLWNVKFTSLCVSHVSFLRCCWLWVDGPSQTVVISRVCIYLGPSLILSWERRKECLGRSPFLSGAHVLTTELQSVCDIITYCGWLLAGSLRGVAGWHRTGMAAAGALFFWWAWFLRVVRGAVRVIWPAGCGIRPRSQSSQLSA